MIDQNLVESFINDVEKLYQAHSKNGDDGFAVQFMKIKQISAGLKQNSQYQSKAGEKPENKKKNRYKDILPFDYSRVQLLSEDETSSYINASFIKGPDERNSYIASQGPLPHTVNDFWKMLWQNKVKVVIMVCREEEQGKHKCERYWSNSSNETKIFGDISVTLADIKTHDGGFDERILRVTRINETRTVYQYHYRGWPDHGVPRTRDAILAVVNEARTKQDYSIDDKTPPLCVHCSAGCGRTGVVLVIDYFRNLLYNQKLSSSDRIFDVVTDMRKQRPAIVQTKDQYEFVHLAVSDLFTKYMKNCGIALASKLSKSLSNSTYENVSFSDNREARSSSAKIQNNPLPTQVPGTKYENVSMSDASSRSLQHSVVATRSEDHYHPPPKPHKTKPASTVNPSLTDQTAIAKESPKKFCNSDQFQKSKPVPAARHPIEHHPVKPTPRFMTPGSNLDSIVLTSANTDSSKADTSVSVISESIQARTQRLFSNGLPSNSPLQKKPDMSASVADLRFGNTSQSNNAKPKLLRTSSMDSKSSSSCNSNCSNNEKLEKDFPKTVDANGKTSETPVPPQSKPKPPLPKKTSIRVARSNLSSSSETSSKKPKPFSKPDKSKNFTATGSAGTAQSSENYSRISPGTKRDADYDMLQLSIKVKNRAKEDVAKDKEDKKSESETFSASVNNPLYNSTIVWSPKSTEPNRTPGRVNKRHDYVEVVDFPDPSQDNDIVLSVSNSKTIPVKPKRRSKTNIDISTGRPEESASAAIYSLADANAHAQTNQNKRANYSHSQPPADSVYCLIGTDQSNATVKTFPSDPHDEDAYSLADDENTNRDALRPRSSSNVVTTIGPNMGARRASSTPPIVPERTPESQLLLPLGNTELPMRTPESKILVPLVTETQEKSTEPPASMSSDRLPVGRSDYEEVTFDKLSVTVDTRRASGTAVKPAQEKTLLGKTRNVLKAGFQQFSGGGSRSADDTQTVRSAKPTSNAHEPVMIKNQDITFNHRLKGKPKGGRPPPWSKIRSVGKQ